MKRRRVGGVADCLNNLTIETAGIEEEEAENLQEVLEMETVVEGGNVVKGEEGGEGNQTTMGDLEFLTQDA